MALYRTDRYRIFRKNDESLLRNILGGLLAKCPIEFLYLETGTIPIRYTLMSRRLNYLYTLLKRDKPELTRKIYDTQLLHPTPGDFCEIVKENMRNLNIHMELSEIENMSKYSFKKMVRDKIKIAAFNYLSELQNEHSKIKDIEYSQLKPQPYLFNPLFTNNEAYLLAALRSRSVRNVKCNMKNIYSNDKSCRFNCNYEDDSQQHMLKCLPVITNNSKLTNHPEAVYNDIFDSNVTKQKNITQVFEQIIKCRNQMMEQSEDPAVDTTSGHHVGPLHPQDVNAVH